LTLPVGTSGPFARRDSDGTATLRRISRLSVSAGHADSWIGLARIRTELTQPDTCLASRLADRAADNVAGNRHRPRPSQPRLPMMLAWLPRKSSDADTQLPPDAGLEPAGHRTHGCSYPVLTPETPGHGGYRRLPGSPRPARHIPRWLLGYPRAAAQPEEQITGAKHCRHPAQPTDAQPHLEGVGGQ